MEWKQHGVEKLDEKCSFFTIIWISRWMSP